MPLIEVCSNNFAMLFLLFNGFLTPSATSERFREHNIGPVIDDIKIITPLSVIVTGTIKDCKFESSKVFNPYALSRFPASELL